MTNNASVRIIPRLIVAGAAEAIEFYVEALGAEVLERYADPAAEGFIVHAALSVQGAMFSLASEHAPWGLGAPPSLGGTPVLITLEVDDARALGKRMEQAGAEVVIPIADQFYGKREGRLRDPFGHLWILSQLLEKLSDEEIHKRMRDFMGAKG